MGTVIGCVKHGETVATQKDSGRVETTCVSPATLSYRGSSRLLRLIEQPRVTTIKRPLYNLNSDRNFGIRNERISRLEFGMLRIC